MPRWMEYILIASTCLTVAYCAAAFNGASTYNRAIAALLFSPWLFYLLYKLILKVMAAVLWLGFQLGYTGEKD